VSRTNTQTILRRAYLAQGLGSTVEGIGLSSAVLYFSDHVGLSAHAIGGVLAFATTAALLLVLPIGVLADRIGLKRSAVGLGMLVVAAFAAYALARGLWLYALGATLFMVTQAGLGAVRQAIVADNVDAGARVRARAVMQTLINAGYGLGTVVGALAALSSGDAAFRVAFALAATLALVCAGLLASLPLSARRVSVPRGRPGLVALRDRRFTAICALATVVLVSMPVISVLLPLWITQRVHAPAWLAPVAFGLNTLIVICAQTRWTAGVSTDARAARSLAIGAVTLFAGCVVIGASGLVPEQAVVTVLAGTMLLTMGEITSGAGMWHLAFSGLPTTAPAQYQAVYAMSGSAARVLGPLAALPLVLAAGVAGWVILGLLMAAATVALSGLALRAKPRAHAVAYG
jgi:MFS family permease